MRKFIVCFLILLLASIPIGSAQGQSTETLAHLLPAGTLVYVEMPGSELPNDLDMLIGLLAPPEFTGSAESLLTNTPFTEEWMDDRIVLGVFSTFDMESTDLRDILPTAAIIAEIADDDAADTYLIDNFGETWQRRGDNGLHTWTPDEDLLPLQILHAPGYMALGSPRAIAAIREQLQSPGYTSLAEQPSFASLRDALSPDPIAWMAVPSFGSSVAFYASDSALSIETLYQGPPLDEVPAALSPDALQGVPIDAILVDAGMNANIGLQTNLDQIRALLLAASQMNEDWALLPLQFEFGLQGALGANLNQEIIPLFDGGYAVYVARNPGVVVEGGLILAPNNPQNLPDIVARIANQVAVTADLSITQSGDAEYTLSTTDGLLTFVAGAQDDRLYVADEIGADSIRIALDDGPNILGNPRWIRALEAAPPGAQHVTYLNVRELLDLLIVGLQRNIDLPEDALTQAITYGKRFESAAIFQRSDPNGVHLSRFVLLFN